MTDRGTIHRVSAGPYTLELPANGVAILYDEDGKQLPGGVGYFEALVQFAGEVIRLRSMLDTISRGDPEITDPRDPHKRRDILAELDAELALIEQLPYRVPIHLLAKRARDEIVGLRASLERHDRLVINAVVVATPSIRDEALEEAARVCEGGYTTGSMRSTLKAIAAAIRALKEKH